MPGRKFFYSALFIGWSLVALFFTISITITGVSFRFGEICHLNSVHSKPDFWGPLLAMASITTILQLAT